jgi:D-psicose/D-tagatose/L-ribulose 3-epimerase
VKLSVSNIAWPVEQDEAVANLLIEHGVRMIDVAPGKYVADFHRVPAEDVVRVRQWWADRGMAIGGMQALLFGTQGLNLFGDSQSRKDMASHLAAACRIGRILEAPRLVFGSPRNRDRTGLSDSEALRIAVDFFREIGRVAGDNGVCLCLEPNPASYGANFMTSTAETAAVVSEVAHPAVRLQLDAGAMAVNWEDPHETVKRYASLVGHVHASEPDLAVLGEGGADHAGIAAALRSHLPDHPVCIEMLTPKTADPLVAVAAALRVAITFYA